MDRLRALNSKEKKLVLGFLKTQFGYTAKLDYAFYQSNKDQIYLMNSDITRIDVDRFRVNNLGLYFGTLVKEEIRLSIEGSQIVGPSATKGVVELDESNLFLWIQGYDLELASDERAFLIVKHGTDFYGCGKLSGGKLFNYVPKARRLKHVILPSTTSSK